LVRSQWPAPPRGIQDLLGIRSLEAPDLEALRRWLETEVCPSGAALEATIEPIDRWCWTRKIQPQANLHRSAWSARPDGVSKKRF
jgi:hypothetical protein